ncbi:hypothetical protein ACSSS7_004970 [Eimeria intestinalis]
MLTTRRASLRSDRATTRGARTRRVINAAPLGSLKRSRSPITPLHHVSPKLTTPTKTSALTYDPSRTWPSIRLLLPSSPTCQDIGRDTRNQASGADCLSDLQYVARLAITFGTLARTYPAKGEQRPQDAHNRYGGQQLFAPSRSRPPQPPPGLRSRSVTSVGPHSRRREAPLARTHLARYFPLPQRDRGCPLSTTSNKRASLWAASSAPPPDGPRPRSPVHRPPRDVPASYGATPLMATARLLRGVLGSVRPPPAAQHFPYRARDRCLAQPAPTLAHQLALTDAVEAAAAHTPEPETLQTSTCHHASAARLPRPRDPATHARAWAVLARFRRDAIIDTGGDLLLISAGFIRPSRTYAPWTASDGTIPGVTNNDLRILVRVALEVRLGPVKASAPFFGGSFPSLLGVDFLYEHDIASLRIVPAPLTPQPPQDPPAYEQLESGFAALLPSPNSCLQPEELTQLRHLLYKFRERSDDGSVPLSATNLLTARLDIGDAPVSTQPRRPSPAMRQGNRFPPRPHSGLLQWQALLLRPRHAQGLYQIGIAEEDPPETRFLSSDCQRQCRRLPFCFALQPSRIQRMVDVLLGAMKWVSDVGYIDDGVAYSDTRPDHCAHLRQLLAALREANLQLLNLSATEATSLTRRGVQLCPSEVKAILGMRGPADAKAVQRLLSK